jgi:hypothetical protein
MKRVLTGECLSGGRVRGEVDYYAAAARLVQQHVEGALHSSGIKAVTSRATRLESVGTTVRKRMAEGKKYGDLNAIREDLLDRAGAQGQREIQCALPELSVVGASSSCGTPSRRTNLPARSCSTSARASQ